MRKQLKLTKKTIKNLKLKLKSTSDRKVAPSALMLDPTNGNSC